MRYSAVETALRLEPEAMVHLQANAEASWERTALHRVCTKKRAYVNQPIAIHATDEKKRQLCPNLMENSGERGES